MSKHTRSILRIKQGATQRFFQCQFPQEVIDRLPPQVLHIREIESPQREQQVMR